MITAAFLLFAINQSTLQTREVRELFALCDKLGLKNDLKKPFVKVRMLYELQPYDTPTIYGVLKSETATDFVVILPSLAPQLFPKVPQEKGGPGCDYQPVDLAQLVKNTVSVTNSATNISLRDTLFSTEEYAYRGSDFPTLAYICSQRGLTDEANFLIDYCKKNGGLNQESIRAAEQASDSALRGILKQFGDPNQSRSDLLDKLKTWAPIFKGYPGSGKFDMVITRLERMIAEDKKHIPNPDPIKEKIWKLRDWPTDKMWFLGGLEEITDIGIPAVPALLDAIKDTTYTRGLRDKGMGFKGDFQEDMNVRVGEAAYMAITSIACRDFNARSREEAERAARKWYAEVMAKGEKAVLVEEVKKGGSNAERQARRLVKAYPDAAFDAIAEGLTKAPYFARPALIGVLKELKSPKKNQLAQQIMLQGGDIRSRIEAAKLLAPTDGDFVLESMFNEWTKLSIEKYFDMSKELVSCFMLARRPEYLKEIQQRLRTRPVSERHDLIVGNDEKPARGWSFSTPRVNPAWEIALEDFLASELDDDVFCGTIYLMHKPSYPLLSELAAFELSDRFPKWYRYKFTNSEDEAKQQRMAMLKIYRTRRAGIR